MRDAELIREALRKREVLGRTVSDALNRLEDGLSDSTIERLREKQTELVENGGCPCCLGGEEEEHADGCELGEAEVCIASLDVEVTRMYSANIDMADKLAEVEAQLEKRDKQAHQMADMLNVEVPLRVAAEQRAHMAEQRHFMVVGSISQWVGTLPKGLREAIDEGMALAKEWVA